MTENTILVVDDEQQIRDLYSQIFSKAGYTVRTAENAEEALDILKHEKYEVMFLDLNLPGMSGIDLCRQIRKYYPMAIPIAVTVMPRCLNSQTAGMRVSRTISSNRQVLPTWWRPPRMLLKNLSGGEKDHRNNWRGYAEQKHSE